MTTIIIELDIDELWRQFRAGVKCGLSTTDQQIDLPFGFPAKRLQQALAEAFMAVRRDCQASANHAVYRKGYGYGLWLTRDRRV